MSTLTKLETKLLERVKNKDISVNPGSGYAFPDTSAIISALSHDLRSPLNSVIGFSEILLSERIGNLNPEQHKQLSIILKRGTELLQTLDQLVDYCKLARKENRLQETLLALHPFLNAEVEKLRGLLPDSGTLLIYTPHTAVHRVLGDENKLSQVMELIFESGLTLLKPQKIIIEIKERPQGERTPQQNRVMIEMSFSGSEDMDPDTLLHWNDANNLPGKVQFSMHLSRFYLTLMGGELSVSKTKGRFNFQLYLCKDES